MLRREGEFVEKQKRKQYLAVELQEAHQLCDLPPDRAVYGLHRPLRAATIIVAAPVLRLSFHAGPVPMIRGSAGLPPRLIPPGAEQAVSQIALLGEEKEDDLLYLWTGARTLHDCRDGYGEIR